MEDHHAETGGRIEQSPAGDLWSMERKTATETSFPRLSNTGIRLYRAVEFPSLKVFKTGQDLYLKNLP
ncbi:hypothetical protein BTVI_150498 [Pitangus sulphuratus]|nr:hypothetical protein BTVI_150498 [Pitangus sulphuratus]